ncbi:hypothetical protein Fmac_028845 [Flemingia macrophylla]|uniref:Phytocyanin domain-containing protein n=1 Tax=Flemingia macrophylla TaxID=520843 RepID=A0ABD1L8R4_9FABA
MAKAIAASFLVLLLAFPTVFATEFQVGDTSGWSLGTNYATWVSGKTFRVGDDLVFKYDSTHGVDEVDETSYSSCSSSNPIKSYTDGNTKISLSSTGKKYFLCPTAGHCTGGMKLEINVVAAASGTPSTPSTPPTTTPSTTPSPPSESGSPATNSTSPSSTPSGAVGASSGIGLLLGSALVFGFMA